MNTSRILAVCTTAALLASAAAHAQCPGSGSCFESHPNPGCSDAACCQTVCNVDPFCCSTMWDGVCVSAASALCDPSAAGPFFNPCNGSTYYLISPGSWTDAQQIAVSQYGGSLATITSAEENEFVRSQVLAYDGNTGRRAWIGFYSPTQSAEFVWVSGEPGCYTNWWVGEPNNIGNENYTELWGDDGGWNNNFNEPFDGGPPNFAVVEIPAPPPCAADLNRDGVVDGADLGLLLSSWGPCTQ